MILLKCFGFKNTSPSKKRYPTVIEELCRQLSLEDLRKSTNNFDEKLRIGTFGPVYKGCLEDNGPIDHYTIYLKGLLCYSEQDFRDFTKEIELLCQLRHPNLVSLIGFCNHKDAKIIVYEYMSNGSLDDYLRSRDKEPLSWKQRLEICIGAARGLHYLHSGTKRTIFHRDIKPSSILLDNNMVPKLSNFELSILGPLSTSKPKPIEVNNIAGTFGYAAPECLATGVITDKCDVYSFGMVLLQMVCTRDNKMIIDKANMLAFQQLWESNTYFENRFMMTNNHSQHLNLFAFMNRFPIEEIIDPNLRGKIAPECWGEFRDITQRCLKYEADERPAMGEVEVLLELALSLQEEADIKKTDNDDYTLVVGSFASLGHDQGPPNNSGELVTSDYSS